ncbi:MAG: hypothetical protein E6J45_03495 [Chloroflexi bacterium]|nr:MAG: hypothetical protein E6J45_03495 [Chloroflexota bacterium]
MATVRAVPLATITLLALTGCGALPSSARTVEPAAVLATASAPSTSHLINAREGLPMAAPTAAPSPPSPPASSGLLVVARADGGAGTTAVLLVTSAGRTVASTHITAEPWRVVAGPAGAYWMQGGRVDVLTAAGGVIDIGPVPGDAGELLVSPDGGEYAYDTSRAVTRSPGVVENRITVQRIGGGSTVIADRVSDPSRPTADAPPTWMYGLATWTQAGIVFRREVTGTCGCAPFDMEMLAGYSAVIDPVTQTVTSLTSEPTCPLSSFGASWATICFHDSGSGGVDQLRVTSSGASTARLNMSGTNVAGYAVFAADAALVAYETVPVADSGCGSAPYPTTLHVLGLASGEVRAAQIAGLHLRQWPAGGPLYATVESAAGTAVVSIDPSTLELHTVMPASSGGSLRGLT